TRATKVTRGIIQLARKAATKVTRGIIQLAHKAATKATRPDAPMVSNSIPDRTVALRRRPRCRHPQKGRNSTRAKAAASTRCPAELRCRGRSSEGDALASSSVWNRSGFFDPGLGALRRKHEDVRRIVPGAGIDRRAGRSDARPAARRHREAAHD